MFIHGEENGGKPVCDRYLGSVPDSTALLPSKIQIVALINVGTSCHEA